jgi:hypothetical protein
MFYNARYYDPGIGRFTQVDTIVPNMFNPQSLNRYTYVLNNPVKYIDPSGYAAKCLRPPAGSGSGGTGEGDAYDGDGDSGGCGGGKLEPPPPPPPPPEPPEVPEPPESPEPPEQPKPTENIPDETLPKFISWEVENWRELPRLDRDGDEFGGGMPGAVYPPNPPNVNWNIDWRTVIGRAFQSTQKIHGNSNSSPKPTWLYKLVDNQTGAVMKYGVTSADKVMQRYPLWYYKVKDLDIIPIAKGHRWQMKEFEYYLNIKNQSPWSVYGH